ncbi:hypothetical protein [Rhodopila globiformis]|uniref:hypothetical protein n=1 Tax=Rhodopila globiformis TaxID=1071 RepID=UPI0011B08114|nr:hypothetical protein [Rhodopila globiformis]
MALIAAGRDLMAMNLGSWRFINTIHRMTHWRGAPITASRHSQIMRTNDLRPHHACLDHRIVRRTGCPISTKAPAQYPANGGLACLRHV